MSNVHLELVEDNKGDLIDILYYHHECSPEELKDWPNPEALDYPVYCEVCNRRIAEIPLTAHGKLEYELALDCE